VRLSRLVGEALGTVPRLLAEIQARLHDLDPAVVEGELQARGFTAEEYTEQGRLAETARRVAASRLEGLAPAVDWLDERHPPRVAPVICHSDLLFPNLHVEGGRVTGVFDWSKATLADPAYDVAATLARLKSGVPGLPAPLRAVQMVVQRRYLSLYGRRRAVDADAVRYYEAAWTLHELIWGVEHRSAGREPTSDVRDRWMHPEVMERGLRRLVELTGRRLWLPPALGVAVSGAVS
jgi:aminoglycoside phosphotransferase (APT) family kinase protein